MASSKDSIEENICPICMYILIQPVTMPCNHELCLPCFKQNVEEANFCCPMCRMRISTWARKASRTKTLVNQERWQEIKRLFSDRVNRRLNGDDEGDDLECGVPVNLRIAKPGEIRTEYEEQLRKLRQEYAEQRRQEQEASEQLIRKLQEQEEKKMREIESLEKQDEELAKELSDIMNKADVFSPYTNRTRSATGTSTCSSGSIKSFIDAMKSNNQASGSPYPYPCLTPTDHGKICVDKDKALFLEQKFKHNEKQLLTTEDLLNLEKQYKLTGMKCSSKASATAVSNGVDDESRTNSTHSVSSVGQNSSLSQDEILQQMSEQLDLGTDIQDSPDCMIVEQKSPPGSSEKKNLRLNLKNTRTVSAQSGGEVIEILDTPTTSVENHDKTLSQTKRSSSSQSNDSISPELAHFRPIRACPLTPPRQLSGGRVVEPMLIRTTPRNLSKSFSTEERSLSDIDASSPIMQKCLEQLEEERKDKVEKMSKSTTTRHELQDSENKNPDPASSVNARKHLINGLSNLNLSRSAEFKDISNSPLPKRKHEAGDEERDVTPKRKKLIIPLEPDLNDNDEVFEINPFDIKLDTISPRNKDRHKESNLVSRSRSKNKVKHKNSKNTCVSAERNKAKDSVQSAITNWTKKQEDLSPIDSNENVPSKLKCKESNKNHDHVKSVSQSAKKDKNITIDNFFARSSQKKPKLRSRDKIRQPRLPEYEYADFSPKKRTTGNELKNNGAVSKLSFSSEGSDSEDSESIFDIGRNLAKGKKVKRISCEFDDADEVSLYGLSRKKKKTEDDASVKGRYKSGSDIKKMTTSKPTANKMNGHSNNNRTVEEFFKVGRESGKRTNTDKTLGELDGIISGTTTGIVSQEEQDRVLALELQKQFDFEHKYHLTAVRLKGSDESYSFRHQKKSV